MKIVTSAQMTALEQASEKRGVSTDTLMEKAGLAVAEAARKELGGAAGLHVLVLVGPGNNGADGLVTARHLQRWGAEVTAFIVSGRPQIDPKMELAQTYGVAVSGGSGDAGMRELERLLGPCRLVIDAVLGTGRSRPLEGAVKEVMVRLAARRRESRPPLLLALDLPSGLNPDTGEVDPACPNADVTVALGLPKRGLLAFPGADRTGRLLVVDIGLPSDLAEEKEIILELLGTEWVGRRLPSRALDSHKGTFGHALVVAGSRNYVGAAFLACQAAVRVGAGLVTLATPHEVYSIAAGKLTEVIHLPLPGDDEGRIHPDAAELIRSVLDRYTCLLVGCGMGGSPGTTEFLERLLLAEPPPQIPLIIDADGLNNLSRLPDWWRRLGGPTTVTPHPGEMATLTGTATSEVQQDRVATAGLWSSHWGVTVCLKGAFTVAADPRGAVRVSPFANPGLASGGTGDVLTGIIAGLMAQGLAPTDATSCGVYIHGRAGESVAEVMGNTGTVASDLIQVLPETISRLRHLPGVG